MALNSSAACVHAVHVPMPDAVAGSGRPPTGDVFELPEYNLSFTPRHGSMIAFQPSQVMHGTRASKDEGEDCQRIGLAISMQRRAINVAIAEHKRLKRVQAEKQQEDIARMTTRHAKGEDSMANS